MCGGSNHHNKSGSIAEDQTIPATPATTDKTYTAPDLRQVYATWQQTGQVPYSYYGAGAPTRDGELNRVMAAYPGAFTTPTTPTPTPTPIPTSQPTQPRSPFADLLGSLFGGSRDPNRPANQ